MRIYVAGPVTGRENRNIEAFEAARQRLCLEHKGATVLIPHWFVSETANWQRAMRASIETLVKCDCIALIPGWRGSKGARMEAGIARQLGMTILEIKEDKK